jgi:hypothetical protein
MNKNIKDQYIICAAILFKNGIVYQEQPINVTDGICVSGRRHNNCFTTAFLLFGKRNIIVTI